MKSEVKKCEECYKTLKIRFIVLSLLKIYIIPIVHALI